MPFPIKRKVAVLIRKFELNVYISECCWGGIFWENVWKLGLVQTLDLWQLCYLRRDESYRHVQTTVSWCLAQNPQLFLLWWKCLCEREASHGVEVAQCAGSICGDTGKGCVADAGGMLHSPRGKAASQGPFHPSPLCSAPPAPSAIGSCMNLKISLGHFLFQSKVKRSF